MSYRSQNTFLTARFVTIIGLNNLGVSVVFAPILALTSNFFYAFLNMWFTVGLFMAFYMFKLLNGHEMPLYFNRQLSLRFLVTMGCLGNWVVGCLLWGVFWGTGALANGYPDLSRLNPHYLPGWIDYAYKQVWPWVQPYQIHIGSALIFAAVVGLMGWAIQRLSRGQETPFVAVPHQLKIDSVVKHLGSKRILSGAWLEWHTGDVVGLLGLNGCGKSTLMKILFGILKADSATIHLDGEYIQHLYLKRHHLAYLPQDSFLPYRWRVKQAIRHFVPDLAMQEKICQDPRLHRLLATQVQQLSGGERRYLEAHLILGLQTAFVMMDEPFSELEPLYRSHMRELIVHARQHQGILVTDHDYHNILAVSGRIVLLRGGQSYPIEDESQLQQIYIPL